MSLSVSSPKLQQAMDIIHLLAEAQATPSCVLTANFEVIQRWGVLRKIFLHCFIEGYRRKLQPNKTSKAFKRHLSTVIDSESYTKNQALAHTCAKACETFNKLIGTTNKELHPSKREPEETLTVNFIDEVRQASLLEKTPVAGNEETFLKGPEKELSRNEYSLLLGAMPEDIHSEPHSLKETSLPSSDRSQTESDSEEDDPSLASVSSPQHDTSQVLSEEKQPSPVTDLIETPSPLQTWEQPQDDKTTIVKQEPDLAIPPSPQTQSPSTSSRLSDSTPPSSLSEEGSESIPSPESFFLPALSQQAIVTDAQDVLSFVVPGSQDEKEPTVPQLSALPNETLYSHVKQEPLSFPIIEGLGDEEALLINAHPLPRRRKLPIPLFHMSLRQRKEIKYGA